MLPSDTDTLPTFPGRAHLLPVQPSVVAVRELMSRVLGLLTLRGASIELELWGEDPRVAVDPELASLALAHLLEALGEASGFHRALQVQVYATVEGVELCLSTHPALEEAQLLGRGSRAHAHAELEHSRSLLELLGSRLEILDRQGSGLTLRFRLPAPPLLATAVA